MKVAFDCTKGKFGELAGSSSQFFGALTGDLGIFPEIAQVRIATILDTLGINVSKLSITVRPYPAIGTTHPVNQVIYDDTQWLVSVASYRFEPKGVRVNIDYLPKTQGATLTCAAVLDEDSYLLISSGEQIQASSTLCTKDYHGQTWTPPVGQVFKSYGYFKVPSNLDNRDVAVQWFNWGTSSPFLLRR
jgi:hypothetical protein